MDTLFESGMWVVNGTRVIRMGDSWVRDIYVDGNRGTLRYVLCGYKIPEMVDLILLSHLFLKLWTRKFAFSLILYFIFLALSLFVSIVLQNSYIVFLILLYSAWLLNVIFKADNNLNKNLFYKTLNIPKSKILAVKTLLTFALFLPHVVIITYCLSMSYQLAAVATLIFYGTFHIELAFRRKLVKWVVTFFFMLVVSFGVLIVDVSLNVTVSFLVLVLSLLVFELTLLKNGVYNRI